MAEFLQEDELPKIDIEIEEGDDAQKPSKRDVGDDDDKKDGDDEDGDDKKDGDDEDGDDKDNKDKDKGKGKDKDRDNQHPLVGTLFVFNNDSDPMWTDDSYVIHEIVQRPDGRLAYTNFDFENKKDTLVLITEDKYNELLDSDNISQFIFKIGSKWINLKRTFVFTISGTQIPKSTPNVRSLMYVKYNVNTGEREGDSEVYTVEYYEDTDGNKLNFPEWFDLQIQLQQYTEFQEEQEEEEEEEEEQEQQDRFPLSFGSLYQFSKLYLEYDKPNYSFCEVLNIEFSGDYFVVREHNAKGSQEIRVDKQDFLTAYANKELFIYNFKVEDKLSTIDERGIPNYKEIYELEAINKGKFEYNIKVVPYKQTQEEISIIEPFRGADDGYLYNFIDYLRHELAVNKLVIVEDADEQDQEEEQEQEEQKQDDRDWMQPPYLKSVNFYYSIRNTDQKVIGVLMGENYRYLMEMVNESEKKDVDGEAGWYWWASTWTSFSIFDRQNIVELDEKLVKYMILLVKTNVEKFANDYFFTNFLFDRIGFLFKDMIINGLNYEYESYFTDDDDFLCLFKIYPINQEEFLLRIKHERIDEDYVSYVTYKEAEKELSGMSVVNWHTPETDLKIVEKILNSPKRLENYNYFPQEEYESDQNTSLSEILIGDYLFKSMKAFVNQTNQAI